MSKREPIKVYHVEVVKKVSTSFDADNNPINKVSKGIIKFVGEEEMAQFIGYTEKRDKDGRMVKTPKVGYHKQLGYLKAKCIRVCDKKQKPVGSEAEDMARVNALLNPPKVKSATESLTERMDRLEAENARLRAENEGLAGAPVNASVSSEAKNDFASDNAEPDGKITTKTRGNKS